MLGGVQTPPILMLVPNALDVGVESARGPTFLSTEDKVPDETPPRQHLLDCLITAIYIWATLFQSDVQNRS